MILAMASLQASFFASVTPESTFSAGGAHWWQTVGGMLLVFGLLIVCLKYLGRFNRRHGDQQADLKAVWNLGPKREIQVLRLGDEVHYIYRHETAMVLLKNEPLVNFERLQKKHPDSAEAQGWQRFLPGGLSLNPGAAKTADPVGDLTTS
ncbi:MAG: flagellar biogenesis protein FliO [Candidatus Krumholzibacteriia bacterium]|jgi:flagellar biogenesis protein FliO